jgi:hypothetical protein
VFLLLLLLLAEINKNGTAVEMSRRKDTANIEKLVGESSRFNLYESQIVLEEE